MDINSITLLGRVGQEPEIINTQQGKQIAKFTLATSEIKTDKLTGEKKPSKTVWHDIVVFDENLIDNIRRNIHKGSKILIQGKIQDNDWVDNNNIKRYSKQIIVSYMEWKTMMMEEFNQTSLIGKVEHEPEISETTNGKLMAIIPLVTTSTFGRQDQEFTKTEHYRIAVFNDRLVQIIKNYVKVGSRIFIRGILENTKWTDQKQVSHSDKVIVVRDSYNSIILLDKKDNNTQNINNPSEFNSRRQFNSNESNRDNKYSELAFGKHKDDNINLKQKKSDLENNFNYNDLDDEIPF